LTSKDLIFLQISKEDSGCVSYLIGSKSIRLCAIVDPLVDVERYLQIARAQRLRITKIIDTHTHADHLSGKRILAAKTGADIVMHALTALNYSFQGVSEGDTIEFGEIGMQVIETPGHTLDHICLLCDGKVLTGDTLLIGDVGRTDLGGNQDEKSRLLYRSLRRLLKLPDETEVYPTHVGAAHHVPSGVKSTIGNEKINNPALKVTGTAKFLKYMREDWPPKPPDYQNVIKVNLGEIEL
jgi:glyoxylase-like metal-dependent hydrolase (beta-lactamase superfamily II)